MKIDTLPRLLALFLIGLIVSIIIGRVFYGIESRAIEAEFDKHVVNYALSIEKEILYNAEALYSLKGFFDNSATVTQDEFRQFTHSVLTRHSSIQALSWVPKVKQQDRAAYEQSSYGQIPLTITERNLDGQLRQAQNRPVYFPVSFIEPAEKHEAALGYDLASNPSRLVALNAAAETGTLTATESITLVQDKTNHLAFLAMLPVYSKDEPHTVTGFISGVFRIQDVIGKATKHIEGSDIGFKIVDKTSQPPKVLFKKVASSHEHRQLVNEQAIHHIGGRDWRLIARPSHDYVTSRHSFMPAAFSLLLIIFTAFTLVYIFRLHRHAQDTEQVVQERTTELQKAKLAIEQISLLDDLTGIANRRHFDTYLRQEWSRGLRNQHAVTLLIIDIDYFKQFNDHYGHLAGDECLKQVAHALSKAVKRAEDLLARYGGEEFAVIVPNTDDGYILAELCRIAVAELNLPHAYSEVALHVTVSVGFSTLLPTDENEPDDLFKLSDEALYKAKAQGRNQSQSV